MKKLFLALSAVSLLVGPALADCPKQKSPPSRKVVKVTFTNGTAAPLEVLWFTFKGGTKIYNTLEPGQSYEQSTYAKHVWGITDLTGKCLGTFIAMKTGSYLIK